MTRREPAAATPKARASRRKASAIQAKRPQAAPPDVADDEVDEASWESFPASDPPGWRDHEPHRPARRRPS